MNGQRSDERELYEELVTQPERGKVTGAAVYELLKQAQVLESVVSVKMGQEVRLEGVTRIHHVYRGGKWIGVNRFGVDVLDGGMELGRKVEVTVDGGTSVWRFESECTSGSVGMDLHFLEVPGEVEVIQRRLYIRIRPPERESARVEIECRPGEGWRRPELCDLSLGGVLVQDREQVLGLKPGEAAKFRMCLCNGQKVETEATVRRVREVREKKGGVLIAFEFGQLEQQTEELLGSVMMAWEREHMRKSRRVGLWHVVGGRNEA